MGRAAALLLLASFAAVVPAAWAQTGPVPDFHLADLHRDYSAKGVKFVFVNANSNEPANEIAGHAKEMRYPFPVYRDGGNAVDVLNAQVTPETFVINAAGTLRYHGAIDDAQNEARVTRKSLRIALLPAEAQQEFRNK